jgi:hypothetical protein
MSRYNVLPDMEAAVATVIRDAAITGLGDRVYSSIPAKPTYPLVVVIRVGGTPSVRRYLDRANIQINVWGENQGQALDIAQECRVVVLEAEGTNVTIDGVGDVWISAVDDSLGMSYVPDPSTNRDRYLFGLLVAGRAN